MKSISRIDQPEKNHHGYYVRVSYRGVQHRKFFSDKKYEGGDAALDAAIKYRNQLERDLGKPRTDRTIVAREGRKRLGVRRYKNPTRRGHKTYYSEVYEVTWCPEPGKIRRKQFAINKYGEEEARRRAYALRRAKEIQMYGAEVK